MGLRRTLWRVLGFQRAGSCAGGGLGTEGWASGGGLLVGQSGPSWRVLCLSPWGVPSIHPQLLWLLNWGAQVHKEQRVFLNAGHCQDGVWEVRPGAGITYGE